MAGESRRAPERRKLALLIANDHYAKSDNQLPDPTEIIDQLRSTLETIQFRVEVHRNIQTEMLRVVKAFSENVRDGDLLLFYFFGHAYSVDEKTYLLPIKDKQIESQLDVKDVGTDAEQVIKQVTGERSSCQLIAIFDCCRPYQLNVGARSSGKRVTLL